jgi:hypothetical protein
MARRSIRFDESHLVSATNLSTANLAFSADETTGGAVVLQRPRDFSVRDWAIYLLHNAAEVEHALMVQYLFAKYSLNPDATKSGNPPTANPRQWAGIIRKIAIEEMGHLLTIQNILRFVGGPMSFEREDFPIPTNIYPFDFELEQLTKDSLAKYVYAEMPANDVPVGVMTHAERKEIEDRAIKAAGADHNKPLNHVGILYASLLDVFADPVFDDAQTAGFPTDTENYQQNPADFRSADNGTIVGDPVNLEGIRVLEIKSIDDVKAALTFIATQGEASVQDTTNSHFERFLEIYRVFPETDEAGWIVPPVFPTLRNPTTTRGSDGEIELETTQLWARLFDLRYRMLLAALVHITALPVRQTDPQTVQKIKTLLGWIFLNLMVKSGDPNSLNVANLAKALAQMPAKNTSNAPTAGAPFGMPYSVNLPDREAERWQYHLDLIASSKGIVDALRALLPSMATDTRFDFFSGPGDKLDALDSDDAQRQTEIQNILRPAG